MDHRVRIEFGNLTEVVLKGRPHTPQCFLYGSEPPPVDTVWKKARENGWKVACKKRSRITGKEKGVDTQLVVDITKTAITTRPEERTTIVIMSGDADVKPAIDECKEWNVEVCMWKDYMSADLKQMKDGVKIIFLDKYFDEITFTNMKFDIKSNPHHLLSLVKTFGVVFQMELGFNDQLPTKKWCRKLESITQWPFQYYWIEDEGKPTNNLVLVFLPEGEDSAAGAFDIAEFLSYMKEHPIQYVKRVQTYLQYEHETSGILSRARETFGSHDDVSTFVADEEAKDWEVKRRTHPQYKTQRYSEACPMKFNCPFGLKCHNMHTTEEKEFFRKNEGVGNRHRKVKLCKFYPRCKKESKDCLFAHGEEDAWCLKCHTQGHFTENCPKK